MPTNVEDCLQERHEPWGFRPQGPKAAWPHGSSAAESRESRRFGCQSVEMC